jgi:hypothetical protein
MKIDFKKIINIKNKKDLSEFKLDEPIFMNNYLFHYLIIFDKLDILKLFNFPIYKVNDDDQNGFLLAAKYNNINILNYFIDTYPDYIYNKNENNELFINYLEISSIIKLLNLKLDWKLLLNYPIVYGEDEIILDNIFMNGTFDDINNLNKFYKSLNGEYAYNFLIMNPNLSSEQIIKLLDKLSFEDLNKKNIKQHGLIIAAIIKSDTYIIKNDTDIIKSDTDIIKYLIDKKIDLDYYTFNDTYHPLRSIYKSYLLSQDPRRFAIDKTYELYWNGIKDTYNYESTNRFLDNIAHFLLAYKCDDKISFEILKNCSSQVWNALNIKKLTPIHYLINMDFDKYNFLLNGKKISKNIIVPQSASKWNDYLKTLETFIDQPDIILTEYEYNHANLFQSKFQDMSMYVIYLNNKYPNLYLPIAPDLKLSNLNYIDEMNLSWADNIFETNPIFTWFISYQDENVYWIHHNLNNLINAQRRKGIYDFAFCYLSLKYGDVLHANIIIYDFNNLTIERFDPFGDTVLYDKKLDEILEEELTWSTGFKYLKPSDFLPVAGFQVISDELNPLNQKYGDFGGYCLAWSTWYLEHRIINKGVEPKILVNKLIKNLSKLNISFNEYIRNYANYLNNFRIKELEKAGIDSKKISNTYNSSNVDTKIDNYIINYVNK